LPLSSNYGKRNNVIAEVKKNAQWLMGWNVERIKNGQSKNPKAHSKLRGHTLKKERGERPVLFGVVKQSPKELQV